MKRRNYKRRRAPSKLSKPAAKAVKAIVKRALDTAIEDKYVTSDNGIGQTVTTIGLGPSSMTVPSLGNATNQRIGNKIRVKSASFKFYIQPPAGENCMYRFIVFQWKSTDPVAPVLTDILQINSATGLVDINSHYVTNFTKDHKILVDRTFDASSVNGNRRHHIVVRKGFAPQWQFNAGTTVQEYAFYTIHLSDSAGLPNPYLLIEQRLTYEDA